MSDLQDTGFWTRFWSRLTGRTQLKKGDTSYPFDSYLSSGGAVVTPETALKLSAVWACVKLRAETISTLPLQLYDSDKKIATDHSLYRILHDSPNADMCASEFWQVQSACLDLWGNAYNLISRRSNGEVIALEPLFPSEMIVKRNKVGSIEFHYTENGKTIIYSEDKILHFKGFTLDGLIGLSAIQFFAQTIGMQFDANNQAQDWFKNGLKVGGFLETGEQTLTKEQRERLRNHLSEFSRPENAGKYMVLEANMKVASASAIRINPVDAQLLESRYFGIEEICRAFGVPPQLIGHTSKASSWASSLEQTNQGFLTYSLNPSLVRYEQTIARKLLLPHEKYKYRPKFAVDGLLRANNAARAEFYVKMTQNGLYTRNEVRELEDMPKANDPSADKLMVQMQMVPLASEQGANNE
ncbi:MULTISPECIES: phage portal protein [unclassified Acinetobacter]|uniref:phage portal protein n=1 Tax=unclassified Acinetobacter TaxID=196816 RepID=UPI0004D4EE1A|nr:MULTISPECIES: phage portal protein [unclassified Acinetobacter]KEC83289.1 phage portal protein [Acinetobacter sp. ETR1]WEE38345.1 phage portal protein [Acinetobacter sp. TAC-1]